MKTVVIGFALACLGASNTAAQMTGMNCDSFGGQVTCRESSTSRAERMNREALARMQKQQEDLQAFARKNQPTDAERAAAETRKLQKDVAAAVKAGRCDEAKRLALDAGDLDTADKAVRLCTPVGTLH